MWLPTLILACWMLQPPTERPLLELTATRLLPGDQGRFTLVLDFTIKEGWHIYAHKPESDLVVPTVLTARFETPIRDVQINYPKGEPKPDPTGDGEVRVYEGKFRLTVSWHQVDSVPEPAIVELSLRFQPCNGDACLPPRTKSWRVRISL